MQCYPLGGIFASIQHRVSSPLFLSVIVLRRLVAGRGEGGGGGGGSRVGDREAVFLFRARIHGKLFLRFCGLPARNVVKPYSLPLASTAICITIYSYTRVLVG